MRPRDLIRRPDPGANVRQVFWDGETVGDWAAELEEPHTAVANLTGNLVDLVLLTEAPGHARWGFTQR